MARDIEEFLRKAAERRNKAGNQPPPQAAGKPPAPPPPPRTLVSEVVDVDEIEVVGGDRIANRHIDTSRIAQHAAQLGGEVSLADDKIEARLHEKFDHDVGRLKKKSQTGAKQSTGGSELLRLLQTPKTIRQAIIVAEILKRPEF